MNDAVSLAERSLQALQAQAAPGGAGGFGSTLVFLGLMIAIFYFMLWRPQQKQAKEHRSMLSALKKGDAVVTSGGVLGRIHAVGDKFVMLEVGQNQRLRVLTSAISGKAPDGLLEETPDAAKAEEKK